jgi:AraC-like DNA-binding protein
LYGYEPRQVFSLSTITASDRTQLVFSANNPDGFGAYHDLYDSGTTVSRIEGPFRAVVSAHRFPRMLLFNRSVAGAVHHRTADRVRRDGFDHVNLQMLRSGSMVAGDPGNERAMSPGDIVVFDTSRPQRTAVTDADYLSVAISRDAIATMLPGIRDLHGTILTRGVAGLLGDLLLSLGRHVASVSPAVASESAGLVGTLLRSLTCASAMPVATESAGGATEMHRWRADAYIDAHLHDRGLDVDAIAAGIGVARTTLYGAFASKGGVAREILYRRVRRLGVALRRPGETRSVSALAFDLGFADESHCSRAFKARFGCPPGQFRAASRREHAAAGPAATKDSWAEWWGGIA